MQKANSYTDMLNAMPAKIRNRFLSLAKFTYETVQEYQESHGIPKRRRLRRDAIQTIQVSVFVFVLRKFLEDGTRATEYAVKTFESIGVKGFAVGETVFAGNNENVQMGRILACKLERTIKKTVLWSFIADARSINELIGAMTKDVLKREQ